MGYDDDYERKKEFLKQKKKKKIIFTFTHFQYSKQTGKKNY